MFGTGLREELYVNNCGREACAPGHCFGPAMRGYHLMHIAASGVGIFDNGARQYEIHAGQGFMIFPDDITIYTADDSDPWDYVWVGFMGKQAHELVLSSGISPEKHMVYAGIWRCFSKTTSLLSAAF